MGCGCNQKTDDITTYFSLLFLIFRPKIIVNDEPLSSKIHNLPKKSPSQTKMSVIETKQTSLAPEPSPGKTKKREFENKGSFTCYFCNIGLNGCFYENYLNHPEPAIRGLFSDFITPYVIASQRLSNRIISEYKIIEQFKEYFLKI